MKGFFYFLSGFALGVVIDVPILILLTSTDWGGEFFGKAKIGEISTFGVIVMICLPLAVGYGTYHGLARETMEGKDQILEPRFKLATILKVIGLCLLPIIGFIGAWLVMQR